MFSRLSLLLGLGHALAVTGRQIMEGGIYAVNGT